MEIADALVDYLQSIKHLETGSQLGYQQRLTVFAAWATLQGIALEQVNNRHVQAFLAWLKEHHRPHKAGKTELSTHTLAGYIRCIWAFLYWCLADEEYQGYVRLQTIKGIKMPRLDKFVKETFTDEEIAALFDACQHESKTHEYQLRDVAILALLLDTGIRARELRTLTIGSVVLAKTVQEDSYIRVFGKGRKERELPLGNRARRALSRYLRNYRSHATKADSVFLSRHGGPMAHETLKDILLRLKELSTLPADVQVNPHKFRHTWARKFMEQGGDIYDLSRFLGHASVAMTENYLKSLGAQAVRTRKNRKSVLDEL